MRTTHINVNGKEYMLCISTRVLLHIEEKYGDSDGGLKQIMSSRKLSDVVWLLSEMIDAGDRYAKMESVENPGTIPFDELLDRIGPDDYELMFKSIAEATKTGTTPTVEIQPQKNAKATQEGA